MAAWRNDRRAWPAALGRVQWVRTMGNRTYDPWRMATWGIILVIMTTGGISGCWQQAGAGVFRDKSDRWFAYRLVERGGQRSQLEFFAVSKKKVGHGDFTFSIGTGGPRRVVVQGLKYRFPWSRKGNLYLVREDGTVYRSPYWMAADEYRRFERLMDETEWSDALGCLRSSLNVQKLDTESRRFLGID